MSQPGSGSRGTHIGRFQVIAELGRGGFGQVLRVFDGQRQRELALKLLLRNDTRAVKRFEREIAAATRLAHPNIVATYESGLYQGRPYMVMEFVPGETLTDLVERERTLSITRAVELLREVARGIAYAHSQGVLHRDLKPDNVLVDQRGSARVLDFGLASLTDSDERLTRTGASIGTPYYMSPEQVAGQAADERTDVYGLGATLFFALTGRAPFEGHENPLMAAYTAEREPPSTLRAEIPRQLDQLCLRSISRERRERPESVEALIEGLDRFLAHGGAPPPRELPRGLLPALFALALAAALGVGLALGSAGGRPSPAPTSAPTSSPAAATITPAELPDLDAALRALLPAEALEALVAEHPGAPPAWRERARKRVGMLGASEAAAKASLQGTPIDQLLEILAKLAKSALSEELGRDRLLSDRVRLAQARLAVRRGREEQALVILSEVQEPFAGARDFLRGLALNRVGRWKASEAVARDMAGQAAPLWEDLAGLFFAQANVADLAIYERRLEEQLEGLLNAPPEADFFRLARRASQARDPATIQGIERDLNASRAADDVFLWVLLADRELNRPGKTELERVARYLERASALCNGSPSPTILRALGQLRLGQGRGAEAADILAKARASYGEDVNLCLLAGGAFFTTGRYAEADKAWADALRLQGDTAKILAGKLTPIPLRIAAETAMQVPPGLEDFMTPALESPQRLSAPFPAGEGREAAEELIDGAVRGYPYARLKERIERAERALSAEPRWPILLFRILIGRLELEAAAEAVARIRGGPYAHLAPAYELEIALGRGDGEAVTRAIETLCESEHESYRELGRAWRHLDASEFEQACELGLDLAKREPALKERIARLLAMTLLKQESYAELNALLLDVVRTSAFLDVLYLRLMAVVGLNSFLQLREKSPQQIQSTLIRFAILDRLGDSEAAGELARAAAISLPTTSPWYQSVPYWLYRLELAQPQSRTARQIRGLKRLRDGCPKEEVLSCWPPGEKLLPNFARVYRNRFGEDPPGHSSEED